jgi:oligoendopeptidase F
MTTLTGFVPEDLNCSDVAQIEPLYQALLKRPLSSLGDLQQWLEDWSALDARIDEFASRRSIAHTCHTDDERIEKEYLYVIEQLIPRLKPLEFQMKSKFVQCPLHEQLDAARFQVLSRSWRTQVAIYRDANVPLQTEASRQTTQFNKINGAMLVEFQGRQMTLQQAARYLEEPDRPLRQQAWELIESRRLQDREPIEAIFEKLLDLRQQIAANADLANYRDYIWQSRERFDYTPEHCLQFGDAVAATVVPVVEQLDRQRQQSLGVDSLRPWDLAVDVHNRPALRPFEQEQIEAFVDKARQMLAGVWQPWAEQFATLKAAGNLDLESRKGKRPGGYQSSLEQSKQPFIFMNAAGTQRDVETLLHEAGHAVHFLAACGEPLVFLRHAPLEFCEVASMSMELLAADHFEAFYNAADAARAKRALLEGIVRILPWIATIDGYQHWLYTHPGHSREQRGDAWLATLDRFSSSVVDHAGLEDSRRSRWQRQTHLFAAPFYYIEYGIAQLGALQVWLNYRQDPKTTIAALNRAFALGATRPLPELFETAGIRFDFSAQTLGPLVQALQAELEALPQ